MRKNAIRTTFDIPAPLYRQLKEQAARPGRSVRDLLLSGADSVIQRSQRPKKKPVRFPLIDSKGSKVELTGEWLYELVEFP